MFIKILLISVILLGLAFLGLAFRTLFVRAGTFPETSVSRNEEMQKLGITCARHDEMRCYRDVTGKGGCGC